MAAPKLTVSVAIACMRPDDMLAEAHAALHDGDLDQAEKIAQSSLTRKSERGLAASILAAVALRRGDPARSLDWAAHALEFGQEDVMTLSNAGEAYRRLGDLEKAADHFERALKMDNMNALLHFNMAIVMRQMGNAPLAEHFFRSAQIADSGMWQSYSNLAELYRDEGHLREAEAEYRSAIRCNPNEPKLLARLGNLLLELGNTKGAVDALETANRLSGNAEEVLFDLAKAYFELCFEASACSVLSRALSMSSQSVDSSPFRVEVVRRASFGTMRSALSNDFGVLAKERRLHIALPKTIPEMESENFLLGIPHAPEVFWARMRGVQILPEEFSVIDQEQRLYVDGIVNWAQFYRRRGSHVHHESDDMRVLLKIPLQGRKVKNSCILLGGGGDWFAWMYECLPRLWSAAQVSDVHQMQFIVPDSLSAERTEMLELFGVRPESLIRQSSAESIFVSELLVPSLLTVGDWVSPIALQYLRRRLSCRTDSRPFRKLFISRGSKMRQSLRNHDEVRVRLLREGFEIIDMDLLVLAEKIKLLSEASAVIGMDDEDLAWLSVLSQGAWVGAMAPRGRYRPRAHLVAAQIGISLVYLFGAPHFADGRALDECDVVMPMPVLEEFLSRIPAVLQ